MSTAAVAILNEIHKLPRVDRQAVYHALSLEMLPRRKQALKGQQVGGDRLSELEAIYGPKPRASTSALWDELRAERI